MKIIIENTKFGFDEGCRLLKLRYETCPFEQLSDIWDEIKPMTFREIAEMTNLEKRRVGFLCLGIERLIVQVNPELVNSVTLDKKTSFIDRNGNLVRQPFKDTYELFSVKGKTLGQIENWRRAEDFHFVKFKDTSTDRQYMIWVDLQSVYQTNHNGTGYFQDVKNTPVNAIEAIAWTIQTTVAEGNVKEIIRQGDCVLVMPKDASKPLLGSPRHLTEKEYRKFLVAES